MPAHHKAWSYSAIYIPHTKGELPSFILYIAAHAYAMTLCGVHDNMHVHTTVAHTCDYPLYLYRHTPPSKT